MNKEIQVKPIMKNHLTEKLQRERETERENTWGTYEEKRIFIQCWWLCRCRLMIQFWKTMQEFHQKPKMETLHHLSIHKFIKTNIV